MMDVMDRRTFIAVNFDETFRKELKEGFEVFERTLGPGVNADFRRVPEESWHITLVFLGDRNDDAVFRITRALAAAVKEIQAPEISFREFRFEPSGSAPKMMWLVTDDFSSRAIGDMRQVLEIKLDEEGVDFKKEFRAFHGHVTLARARDRYRRAIRGKTFPFRLSFRPRSIELMESELGRGGARYSVLQSFRLEHP